MQIVLRDDDGRRITDWWWTGDHAITIRRDCERWTAEVKKDTEDAMKQDPETIKGPFVAVLDDRQFGPAETLIGNAIVWHQPTRWSRFTALIYQIRTRGIGGPLKCRECGVTVGAGWGFWYHQAQAAIELMREHLK